MYLSTFALATPSIDASASPSLLLLTMISSKNSSNFFSAGGYDGSDSGNVVGASST